MTAPAGTATAATPAPAPAPAGRVPDGDVALRFDGVSVTFATGTAALRGVSFDVPRGQVCAIIGPSGAGKSTLLRTVNGMQAPTAGRVLLDGEPVTRRRLAAVRRRIGMVHQQFHLIPRLPVLDNVVAGALPALSVARVLLRLWPAPVVRRACELLDQVGLDEDHLYRQASQLSGGQQQRVAIARAFMLRPDVVLADEPVASLDPAISRGVLRLLADASRQAGATVLCCLHQIELARELGDRVIALRAGEVVFDGPPERVDDAVLAAVFDDPAQAVALPPGDGPMRRSDARRPGVVPPG